MRITLTRVARPKQTLGVLRVLEGGTQRLFCCTLELPWREEGGTRATGASCIRPAPNEEPRTYRVVPREVPWSKFPYRHLHIKGTPETEMALFHIGNELEDTDGCILPGQAFTDYDGDGETEVTESRYTLKRLVDLVPEDGCPISVSWAKIADMQRMVADAPDLNLSDTIADTHLA